MPEGDQNIGSGKNLHEIGFINSFVIAPKKQRFLEFINSKKGRAKFTVELDHPNFISEIYAGEIPPSDQTPEKIEILLKEKHCPETGYLISSDSELDGLTLPREIALKRIVGNGFGTIISFIPGKLAYFENEDGDIRFILERPNAIPRLLICQFFQHFFRIFILRI